jgi:hypothetical protein
MIPITAPATPNPISQAVIVAWSQVPGSHCASTIKATSMARKSNADAQKQINRRVFTQADSPLVPLGYTVSTDRRV